MDALASLLFGLAVLLVAVMGLAAMFGADKARDALARAAAGATVAALFLPYAGRVLAGAVGELGSMVTVSFGAGGDSGLIALVVAGHASLAGAWAYARLGPPAFIENIERARGRGRERVMPALESEVRDE
jgi:hypothetical protein